MLFMELTKPERAKIVVRYLCKEHGKSQQEIGQMLGYTNKASWSAILNGKSRYFSDKVAERIVDLFPEINIDFINGGADEMLVAGREQPAIPELALQQKPERPAGVYLPLELVKMFTDLSATIRSQQETIRLLVGKGEPNAKAM